jgi:hypothetical protein
VGGGAFPGDEKPRSSIFIGLLTVLVLVVLPYRVRHSISPLPEDPTPVVPTQYKKSPGVAPESLGESQPRLQEWAITDVPRYPKYKTPTVAPEPFIEWVVRAVHSTGGIIGTHMLLWVPSQD